MSKTATFIKKLKGFTGDARLYRVDPPMKDEDNNDTDHVVVSATVAPFSGPETYIFASGGNGEIASWLELEGSFQGALDHEGALAGAGYKLAA